jgi:GTPase SAR1 family protein
VAAVIVYDITARDTYEAVLKWKQDIDNKVFLPSGAKIPVLLLGNKADLLEEPNSAYTAAVSNAEVEQFVKENNFYAHYICSAKTGLNVKEACTHLVAKIHSNNQAEILAAEKEKELQQQSANSIPNNNNHNNSGNNAQNIKLGEENNNDSSESSGGCCS